MIPHVDQEGNEALARSRIARQMRGGGDGSITIKAVGSIRNVSMSEVGKPFSDAIPRANRASIEPEYIVPDLKDDEFDIIEPAI
jgi:hypothetical protein